jgi:hypothetical protein
LNWFHRILCPALHPASYRVLPHAKASYSGQH